MVGWLSVASAPLPNLLGARTPSVNCSAGLGQCACAPGRRLQDSYLVDSASSHMLVSKIKPCMSKYKQSIR